MVAVPRGWLERSIKIPEDQTKIAYLAGLVDGEGSIFLKKNNSSSKGNQPFVAVFNTDIDMINWVKDNFGGRIVKAGNGPLHGWKQEYSICIRKNEDVILVLEAILPFLITKRKAALSVLAFARDSRQSLEARLTQ